SLGIDTHYFDSKVTAFDRLDACQPLDLDALGLRLVCLEGMCRHVSAISAVYDERFFGAQTPHGTGCVHGSIAPAIDNDAPTEQRRFPCADAAQQGNRIEHLDGIARGNVDVL